MRLRRLTLQGYKSFATKAEFVFPTGVTAIVGPNGSGKSNIADAILWVLGEQSMHTLRGRASVDMIFDGGRRRGQAGMAEVALTLDNSDGFLPIDFSEVTVSRRAYRSGENEYLINGSRVRLRDISQMLAESGLGQRAYVVIGQGLVDALLSLRSQDRRALIEEAAGIGFYRSRREEAIQRLEQARRNLDRVRDIISEIAPRLKRLNREVQRVEEHRRVTEHLRRLRHTWYGYHWGQHQIRLDVALQRVGVLEGSREGRRERVGALREQAAGLRDREVEQRTTIRELEGRTAALRAGADEARRELAVLKERARSSRARSQELLAEVETLRERRAGQASQVATSSAEVERASRHSAECEHRLTILSQRVASTPPGALEVSALAETARMLGDQRADALVEVDALRSEQEAQSARLAQANDALAILQHELEAREQETLSVQQELAAMSQRERNLVKRCVYLEQEQRLSRGRLREQRELYLEATAEVGRLAGVREALEVAGSKGDSGPRAVLESGDVDGVVGLLLALIQVPPQWECAIEAALGHRLQSLVVERASAVAEVRRVLGDVGGRVTLLPLDSSGRVPSLPSAALCASHVVSHDERIRPAVQMLLGAVALCADLPAAQELLPLMPPGSSCVTRTGDVVEASGALTVGREAHDGVPWNDGTWRELPALLQDAQSRCDQIQAQQRAEGGKEVALAAELSDCEAQVGAIRDRQARVDRDSLAVARARAAACEEGIRRQGATARREGALLARVEDRLHVWSQRAEELEAERVAAVGRAEGLRSELDSEVASDLQSQDVELVQHAGPRTSGASDEAVHTQRHTLARARTEAAVVTESLRAKEAVLDREKVLLGQLEERLSARLLRADALVAECAEVTLKAGQQRTAADQIESEWCELRDSIQSAEDEAARMAKERAVLEKRERKAQDRLRDLETRLGHAQLEVSRCRDELALLSRRIEEDLGLVELELAQSVTAQTPLPLESLVSPLPVVEELPDSLEPEMQRLQARLRRLGSANPGAVEEYNETRTRHCFLTEQVSDLESASIQLQEVVGELDGVMESRFIATFEAVADSFSKKFTVLFNGGSAELMLTDPHEPLSSGIEIVARPPRKRAKRLALLSGGERALAASAVLFALLDASPTPFCVLDEVDAMLDSSNVGRFRALLEVGARQTQFIVVTHNRGTVEAADAIYGISMGADGVSQAVSMRLDR